MKLHGWGRYPQVECQVLPSMSGEAYAANRRAIIARGLGRSYGDSSLADTVATTRHLDQFLSFDPERGVLQCAAGVSLADVVQTFAPKGWFPVVTPGTAFVTIGGAIASDVHGKNHHRSGSFSDHVQAVEILTGNGCRVKASRTENADLFRATCGGMGLTGIILEATVQLRPISSSRMVQTTISLSSLDHAFAAFEEHEPSTYSVAWIDCMAGTRQLGRGILFLGEHDTTGSLECRARRRLSIPLDAPAWLTSRTVFRGFNAMYHARAPARPATARVTLDQYFYPLDSVLHWNRLYGRQGLLQHQFMLPCESAKRGVRAILEHVARSGCGSFLAVLKKFGDGNENLLSFPARGYTMALDFKAGATELALLDRLDHLVLEHGGRIYLAKDARMSRDTFRRSYPQWQEFEAVRAHWHAHGHFASRQSRRLGLQ